MRPFRKFFLRIQIGFRSAAVTSGSFQTLGFRKSGQFLNFPNFYILAASVSFPPRAVPPCYSLNSVRAGQAGAADAGDCYNEMMNRSANEDVCEQRQQRASGKQRIIPFDDDMHCFKRFKGIARRTLWLLASAQLKFPWSFSFYLDCW